MKSKTPTTVALLLFLAGCQDAFMNASSLTSVATFTAKVFVRSVDVTDVSYGAWQERVVHTSPPTTGPNLDTFGNSSKKGGIGRD
jgi:hypothetical protein